MHEGDTLKVGMSCASGSQRIACDPLTGYCKNSSGLCEKLPVDGQPCAPDCDPLTHCVEGTCRNLVTAGGTCMVDGECVSDVCAGGRCVSLIVGDTDYCEL